MVSGACMPGAIVFTRMLMCGGGYVATPNRVLRAIEKRDGNECVWHGESCGTDVLVPQHRQGGMGGSKTKHRKSNVLWLCSLMNGDIEANADLAEVARFRGIKVAFYEDPADVPVLYPDGCWYRLDDEGGRRRADESAEAS